MTRDVLLDPADGWCQFVRGYVALYHHRYDEAEEHYDRAIAVNPNDVQLISEMGAFKKAREENEKKEAEEAEDQAVLARLRARGRLRACGSGRASD